MADLLASIGRAAEPIEREQFDSQGVQSKTPMVVFASEDSHLWRPCAIKSTSTKKNSSCTFARFFTAACSSRRESELRTNNINRCAAEREGGSFLGVSPDSQQKPLANSASNSQGVELSDVRQSQPRAMTKTAFLREKPAHY